MLNDACKFLVFEYVNLICTKRKILCPATANCLIPFRGNPLNRRPVAYYLWDKLHWWFSSTAASADRPSNTSRATQSTMPNSSVPSSIIGVLTTVLIITLVIRATCCILYRERVRRKLNNHRWTRSVNSWIAFLIRNRTMILRLLVKRVIIIAKIIITG